MDALFSLELFPGFYVDSFSLVFMNFAFVVPSRLARSRF